MTIKEALESLHAAYPAQAVNVEVSCWRWSTGRYEAKYSAWNGVRHFVAPNLDDAVELALSAAEPDKTIAKTSPEEPHFAHAGELNAISEANS